MGCRMKEEIKQKIIDAYLCGEIETDSDIVELAYFLGISAEEATRIILKKMHEGTPCAGCKNLGGRFTIPADHPCYKCTRRLPDLKDMFEPE